MIMLDVDNKYWIAELDKCAKHLNDEEFETLQGLIRKVDVLSDENIKLKVMPVVD